MDSTMVTVLVVEDEALIALNLQMLLEDAGYQVLGPASTPGEAMSLLDGRDPDVALLDVNLGQSDAFEVANKLAARKTKLVFLTGHSVQNLPEAHRHWPLISKPYPPHAVLQAVADAVANLGSMGETVAG